MLCTLVGGAVVYAFPPPLALVAEVCGLLAFGYSMRMLDVVRRQDPAMLDRVLLALLIYDPRGIQPSSPRLDLRCLAEGVGFVALAGTTLVIAALADGLVRTIAGMAFFYAFLGGPDALARTVFAAVGLRLPALQRSPIRARSATDLWGRRWNREVGSWLERWCFRPFSRRGHPVAGTCAAFGFSAALHGVPTAAVVGATLGLQMAAFFLVHGVIVLLEGWLGVPRWRPVFGHVWTLMVFVLTAPLFVEPGLAVFGLGR